MQVSGEVLYNGVPADQFVMGRTAAYVDQTDNHIAELTVSGRLRRTLPKTALQTFSL